MPPDVRARGVPGGNADVEHDDHDRHPDTRPVPRWVRVWAILTLVAAVVLLVLGGFVTSFRVGMADPVWPTEPWYLARATTEFDLGYLVEHTHRIAGFAGRRADRRPGPRGVVVRAEPAAAVCSPWRRSCSWSLAFGEFHGAMMQSWKRGQGPSPPFARLDRESASLAGAVAAARRVRVAPFVGRHPGRWVRAAAGVGLVVVMVQGLLGGFRVFLNELVGTDLAAVHGVFAQVVFCVLVAVVVFAAPRTGRRRLPAADRRRLGRLAWGLRGPDVRAARLGGDGPARRGRRSASGCTS